MSEQCPDCGENVESMFDHITGCPTSPAEMRWGEISDSTDPAEYATWKVLIFLRRYPDIALTFERLDDERQIALIDNVVRIIKEGMGL